MKTVILLLSVIFILTSGCGDSEEDSENDTTPDPKNEREERNINERTVIPSPETPSPGPTETVKDPCAEYSSTCQNDKECGEKYTNCLRSKAGKPATTEVLVCTRTQETKEEKITSTLNEWDAPSGDNSLLCDFLELEDNTEYLIQFATVVKDTCKKQRDARKQELEKAGYSCAPKKEEAQPQEQPQGGGQHEGGQPQGG